MIDLLQLLHEGKITISEAYAVQDGNTSSFRYGDDDVVDWLAAFGLSKDELKITGLEEMVRLRYEGWPKTCAQCNLPLDYKTEHCSDRSRLDGEIWLIHSSCSEEWAKGRWKSAVDALARVGLNDEQIRTLLANFPANLSESEEESERRANACNGLTDLLTPEQSQRSQIIDLIALLHDGKITLNEADDIFSNATAQIPIAEGDPEFWAAPLGLSRHEARAVVHAAGPGEVLLFRYQGWPTICAECNLPLDHETDEWHCDVDKDGKFCLLHTDCWSGDGPMQKGWYFAVHALERAGVSKEEIRAVLGSSPPKMKH